MRSPFVTLLQTNKTKRCLPCPFVGDCSAGRPYRCVRRARSRRPHTHATCERRIDAKAFPDEVVVAAEVNRCIDENSASNHGLVAFLSHFHRSFIDASSIEAIPNRPFLKSNPTLKYENGQIEQKMSMKNDAHRATRRHPNRVTAKLTAKQKDGLRVRSFFLLSVVVILL